MAPAGLAAVSLAPLASTFTRRNGPRSALATQRLRLVRSALPGVQRYGSTVSQPRTRHELRAALTNDTKLLTSGDPYEAPEAPESFRWFKHWYPVHVAEYLDPTRPHPLKLFGCNLVLWKDGDGKWQCFEDACPHRLAPLSEGRVEEDGQLLCAYHGWKFGSAGECKAIPQSERPVSEWTAKQQEACAVASYPTKEAVGLIWVWPETGAEARKEAEATSMRGFSALFDEEGVARGDIVRTAWSLRDLPYGWDYFIENVTDPAHVPVSHHNVVGNRYKDPRFFKLLPVREMSAQEGMEYSSDRQLVPSADPVTSSSTDFQPPCLVRIRSDYQSQTQTNLCLFAVPTTPGRCRYIGCQVLVKNKEGELPKGLAFFSMPMPKFLFHILAPLFLHQDQVFLHHQERIVNHRSQVAGVRGEKLYTTPTPADTMVLMFRRWFAKHAGGTVPWVPGTDTTLQTNADPVELYDTYNAHTRHCRICQGALKGVELWQKITSVAAVLAAVGAVTAYAAMCASKSAVAAAAAAALRKGSAAALAAVPTLYAPSPGVYALLALALLFLAANVMLGKLKPLFFKYEFSHADNH